MNWWQVAAILVGGYCLLAALMFLFQSQMVHLPGVPGRELIATPARIGLEYEDVTFHAADGTRLHGWFVPAAGARQTVIFYHGNAGNISHRLDSLRIWHALGVNAFIFDYRGYGRSDGRPREAGLHQDALAAWSHVHDERGIPAAEIVLFGRSLGGALAACTAAERAVSGLILESTFISALELGTDLYPWLPVRWLVRLEYDTERCLADVSAPVLVVHSEDDDIVPYRHGMALAAASGGRLLTLHGDHNTGFLRAGERYRQGLGNFLSEIVDRM